MIIAFGLLFFSLGWQTPLYEHSQNNSDTGRSMEGRSIGCVRDKSAPTGVRVIWLKFIRQGSKERDSSSSPERSSPALLSAAKQLAAGGERPFALLRVTWCDCSNCQRLFFTFEPCLKRRTSRGAGYAAGSLRKRTCLRRASQREQVWNENTFVGYEATHAGTGASLEPFNFPVFA